LLLLLPLLTPDPLFEQTLVLHLVHENQWQKQT
jgi:hypothetical protein